MVRVHLSHQHMCMHTTPVPNSRNVWLAVDVHMLKLKYTLHHMHHPMLTRQVDPYSMVVSAMVKRCQPLGIAYY